jgi:hypothetical protein
MMNFKGYGRKQAWPNLTLPYHPCIRTERLRKLEKSKDNCCPGRYLNWCPSEDKSEVLPLESTVSALLWFI